MSASAVAAQTTRDQWNHYLNTFAPLEKELIADINSTAIVDNAAKTVANQTAAADGVLDRTMERYGMQNAPAVQQERLERQQALGDAANAAQTMNTARLDQRDRNMALASTMMQQGRGVAGSGMSALSSAASNEASRNSANAQLKAQRSAQTWSTIGTLGSIAMFMM